MAAARERELTLQEAADLLGVHYMTAYRYVRTGRLAATRTDGKWVVARSSLDQLARPAAAGRGRARRVRRRDYAGDLVPLLVAGDEAASWQLVQDALTAAYTPEELYCDVLATAMHMIGERWATGAVSVAEEHRATALAARLVGRLGGLFVRRGRRRGLVVLGAPSGDTHALATALVADPVRGRGFAVADLGADTPVTSFAEVAADPDTVGVGIVVSTPVGYSVVRDTITAIRAVTDAPVLLGGVAIDSRQRARALGADAHSASMRAAIDWFGALPRERER
jgi:excisionase family DNA binding protein